MTKNIKVTDSNSNLIGFTYPKRGKGMVKKGRAEIVSDFEIRLTDQCPAEKLISEDDHMNILNFHARDFKFDQSCEQNAGSRMFLNDDFNNCIEIFEIGDWHWNWTQINSQQTLEKNTDYLFRFSVKGGINSTFDETLQFIVTPADNWEDRCVFQLAKSAYRPVLSKKSDDGSLLRVFEIPFNSGDCTDFIFIFAAMHAVADIMPAHELETYENLEDITYQQLMNESRSNQNTVCSAANFGCSNNNFDGINIDLSDAVITEKALNRILSMMGNGANIDLTGAVINNEDI